MGKLKRRVVGVALAAAGLAVVAASVFIAATLISWLRIDRTPFDLESAREFLGIGPAPTGVPGSRSLLLVGLDDDRRSADAILLLTWGPDRQASLLSVPRDIAVADGCTSHRERLGSLIAGCGEEVSGAERLAVSVEQVVGAPVDHIALFDQKGFHRLVDGLGGVEVCTEHPLALRPAGPVLVPDGCHEISGGYALGWVRSRSTVELIGERWRAVDGVGDEGRTERQQEMVMGLLSQVRAQRSPGAIHRLAELAHGTVTIDDRLGLLDVLAMARHFGSTDLHIDRRTLDVTSEVDDEGFWLHPVDPAATSTG